MRFYNFNAVSVSNKKNDKPKFTTTTPKKPVEEPKVKKTRAKQTEQSEE